MSHNQRSLVKALNIPGAQVYQPGGFIYGRQRAEPKPPRRSATSRAVRRHTTKAGTILPSSTNRNPFDHDMRVFREARVAERGGLDPRAMAGKAPRGWRGCGSR